MLTKPQYRKACKLDPDEFYELVELAHQAMRCFGKFESTLDCDRAIADCEYMIHALAAMAGFIPAPRWRVRKLTRTEMVEQYGATVEYMIREAEAYVNARLKLGNDIRNRTN